MDIQITSRHFKARQDLLDYTKEQIENLTNIYDGIVNAEVILEFEPHNEGKRAEIVLMVYHDQLIAKESGDDFEKSVASCVSKIEKQLRKYKERLRDVKAKEKTMAQELMREE